MLHTDHAETTADVQLTHDEVRVLSNSLNEVLNGISDPEYSTRVGASRNEARDLLRQLRELLRHFPEKPTW